MLTPADADRLAAFKKTYAALPSDERQQLDKLLKHLDNMPGIGPDMAMDIVGCLAIYLARHPEVCL